MSKIARLVTIDVQVYQAARMRGINLSDAAEQGIRSAICMDKIEEKAKACSPAMEKALSLMTASDKARAPIVLSECPGKASAWKRRIKNLTNMDVSEDEILKVFGNGED